MWVRERFLSLWTRYRGALFLTISSSRSECNRKADAFRRRFIRLFRMTLGGGYNTRPSSRSIGTSFGVYGWFWQQLHWSCGPLNRLLFRLVLQVLAGMLHVFTETMGGATSGKCGRCNEQQECKD